MTPRHLHGIIEFQPAMRVSACPSSSLVGWDVVYCVTGLGYSRDCNSALYANPRNNVSFESSSYNLFGEFVRIKDRAKSRRELDRQTDGVATDFDRPSGSSVCSLRLSHAQSPPDDCSGAYKLRTLVPDLY